MGAMMLQHLVLTSLLIGWFTAANGRFICPSGWNARPDIGENGTCFRVFSAAKWTDARSQCRLHDAFLIDIRSGTEGIEYLNSVYTLAESNELWSGLHVHRKTKRLIRDDFAPFTVNTSIISGPRMQWAQSQPNITNGHCVMINTYGEVRSARYSLQNCSNSYRFMCQRKMINPVTTDDHCAYVGWESGMYLDSCYQIQQSIILSQKDAREMCQQIRVSETLAELVKPTSQVVLSYLADVLLKADPGQNSELRYWTDLKYNSSEAKFVWSNGTPLVGRSMISTKTRQNFTCTQVLDSRDSRLTWQWANCSQNGRVVCELPKPKAAHQQPVFRLNGSMNKTVEITDNFSFLSLRVTGIGRSATYERVFIKDWTVSPSNSSEVQNIQGYYWYNVWQVHPLKLVQTNRILAIHLDYLTYRCQLDASKMVQLMPLAVSEFNLFGKMDDNIRSLADKFSKDIQKLISGQTGWKTVNLAIKHIRYKGYLSQSPLLVSFDAYVKLPGAQLMEGSGITNLTAAIMSVINMTYTHLTPADLKDIKDSLKVLPTRNCQSQVLGSTTLPMTAPGETFETCEASDMISLVATCVGDFYDGLKWDIAYAGRCMTTTPQPSISQSLDNLIKWNVTADNAFDIANSVAAISRNTSDLVPDVINKITMILENIVELESVDIEAGRMLCMTIDNVMKADSDSLKQAQQSTSSSTRILQTLDRYTERANLGNKATQRQAYDTFAVDMWNVRPDFKVNGIRFLQVTQPPSGTKDFNWFTNQTLESASDDDDDDDDDDVVGTEVAIYLPRSLIEERLAATPNGQDLRMSFIVQRLDVLFSVQPSNYLNATVQSSIVSATLGNKEIKDLPEGERIRTVFFINETRNKSTPHCVYWDFSINEGQGGWSNKGCILLNTTGMDGYFECECDHLTNFAVLVEFGGKLDDANNKALTIITIIGLSLSIIGLSLTVITFIAFPKVRTGKHQKTLFNLALALLTAWVIFLVGIILSQEKLHDKVGCMVMAILLHYFLLVGFMWMLVEAVLQYLSFVKVLDTYIPHFIRKACVIAWGIPLIPVIAVLIKDYELYYRKDSENVTKFCWMDQYTSYFAFLLPVGLVILINLIVFCLVLWAICNRPKGLQTNQSKSRGTIISFQAGVACFILLGLTWIFGYLAIESARLPFQYIFTILNSFHGFFIFLIFTLRDKRVRQHWRDLCCKKEKRKQIYTSSEMSSNTNKHGIDDSSSNSTSATVVSSNTRFKRLDSSGNSIKYEKEGVAFMNNGYKQ